MVVKDKAKLSLNKLAFWQSKAFYVLTRADNGRVYEELAGPSKPKGVDFIKGGRKQAYTEATRRWPGKVAEGEDESETGKVEPGVELGISPSEAETIVSLKPARITPRLPAISPRTPRISGGV